MASLEQPRARRYTVNWPVRVRSVGESEWKAGQVVDLSVTGVLFQLPKPYPVGAKVEVEIDFLAQDSPTIVSGVGVIVREHSALKNAAAVRFDTTCGLATRNPADRLTEVGAPLPRQPRSASGLE